MLSTAICKFFLTISCLHVAQSALNVYHLNKLITSIEFDRNKREATDNDEISIEKCLQEMHDNIKSNLQSATVSEHSVNIDLGPKDIEVFCTKVYNEVDKCISKCPDNNQKSFITTGFGPLKYICVDNYDGAKNHFACPYKIISETKDACMLHCNASQNSSKPEELQQESLDGDSEITVVFKEQCKQQSCIFNCQIKQVSSKCDEKSVAFVKGLEKTGMKTAAALLKSGGGKSLPAECKSFMDSL